MLELRAPESSRHLFLGKASWKRAHEFCFSRPAGWSHLDRRADPAASHHAAEAQAFTFPRVSLPAPAASLQSAEIATAAPAAARSAAAAGGRRLPGTGPAQALQH